MITFDVGNTDDSDKNVVRILHVFFIKIEKKGKKVSRLHV